MAQHPLVLTQPSPDTAPSGGAKLNADIAELYALIAALATGAGLIAPVTLTEAAGSSALTIVGATQTTSQPVLNLSQTWNAAGVAFNGVYLNITNTASAATSKLINLQIGGATYFSADRSGNVIVGNVAGGVQGASLTLQGSDRVAVIRCNSNADGATIVGNLTIASATAMLKFATVNESSVYSFIRSVSAGVFALGGADAAAPVAQFLSVQNVLAGTVDTSGVNFTIRGSQGTGTGNGGAIIFQTAAPTVSGGSQGGLTARLSILGAGGVTINAPTSGVAFQATGVANSYTAVIQSSATSGQGYGLRILAGTTSGDNALIVQNQSGGSTFLTINGIGNVTIAAPTSGVALGITGANNAQAVQVTAGTSAAAIRITMQDSSSAINITNAAATQTSPLQFGQTGQTSWFFYQPASSSDFRINGGGDRFVITNAGNVGIPAPTSGDTLLATALIGSYALRGNGGTTTGANVFPLLATGSTDQSVYSYIQNVNASGGAILSLLGGNGAISSNIYANPADMLTIGNSTAHGVKFLTTNTVRLTIAAAGNVTIAVPASGNALTVNGFAGATALSIAAAYGGSIGIQLALGTGTGSSPSAFSVTGSTDGTIGHSITNSGTGVVNTSWIAGTCAAQAYTTASFAKIGTTSAHAFSLQASGVIALTVAAAGNVSIVAPTSGVAFSVAPLAGQNAITTTGAVKLGSFTVAGLPAAATVGAGSAAYVTDSNTTHTAGVGAIVAAGGTNFVPVYSDGTNWRIG